jgi:hypothetical protein
MTFHLGLPMDGGMVKILVLSLLSFLLLSLSSQHILKFAHQEGALQLINEGGELQTISEKGFVT